MVSKALLRFARSVVQNVLSQLTQQMNIVQDQAYSPMQQMVQEVVGGVWTGRGADAFVGELNDLMMPRTNRIAEEITTLNQNIVYAVERIDEADNEVQTAVNSLGDLFSNIY